MADQKALKKRLKALMQRPENQVCSDCPEKKPTWASLIVPPPGAPPGTEKLGAFCCLECSGSHRRLGVHISFVRSVNLDAWKEWEVRAMEYGGNAKVNAIFEAKLAQSGRTKPSHLADGPTRERYIRDKYERRKFYDPAGFHGDYSQVAAPAAGDASGGASGAGHRPGAPSDIARQRVASRQARMKPAQSNVYDSQPVAPAPPKVAPAPVSAPVMLDLLDFGFDSEPAPVAPAPTSGNHDPFASPPPAAPAPPAAAPSHASVAGVPAQPPVIPPPQAPVPPSASSTLAQEFMSAPAPAPKPATSNESIMALFGPPKTQQPAGGYGMQAMAGMMPPQGNNSNNMMMMGGMMPQQQMNQTAQGMNHAFGNVGGMMMNNSMGANSSNPQMMMMQQRQPQMMQNNMMMMMNPQMQQQQMMMNPQMQPQQQMMMMQQNRQPQMGMNNMSNGGGMNGNNNFNSMMQGMQNMQMGNHTGTMVRQASDDGDFGAPMGGGGQSDPFGSLGGMNAFR